MATSEPPLIGALMRIPLDRVYREILRALHAHGGVELAQQAGMTRQAMNYLLGRLEELGYIERRRTLVLNLQNWVVGGCLPALRCMS